MARRLAVLLVAGLLAAVLTAGAAGAQANPAQPTKIPLEPVGFSTYFNNYCNDGETVYITGTLTGFMTQLLLPNGEYKSTFHYHMQGTGEGSDGNNYIYNETGTSDLQSEGEFGGATTVYTGEGHTMLNSLGSDPNVFFRVLMHITGSEIKIFNYQGYCRG
jgi:hypothetical protein